MALPANILKEIPQQAVGGVDGALKAAVSSEGIRASQVALLWSWQGNLPTDSPQGSEDPCESALACQYTLRDGLAQSCVCHFHSVLVAQSSALSIVGRTA